MIQAAQRSITRRSALKSATAAAIGAAAAVAAPLAVAVAASDSPDAMLLAMGQRLAAAWKHEAALYAANEGAIVEGGSALADAYDAASEACGGLIDGIMAMPASTHAGLMVKALAFRWWWCGVAVADSDTAVAADELAAQPSSLQMASTILQDIVRQSVAEARI